MQVPPGAKEPDVQCFQCGKIWPHFTVKCTCGTAIVTNKSQDPTLAFCPKCRKTLNSASAMCPHCGYGLTQSLKWGNPKAWLLVVSVALLSIFGIAFSLVERAPLRIVWRGSRNHLTWGYLQNRSGKRLTHIKFHPSTARLVNAGGLEGELAAREYNVPYQIKGANEDNFSLEPDQETELFVEGSYQHFDMNEAESDQGKLSIDQDNDPDPLADTPNYQ